MRKFLCAGLIALASLAASAQSVTSGMVTGTTPTGIYLTNNNGTSYIPYGQASFTINGQPIEARYVIDGMNVNVYSNNGYQNQYNGQNYYNTQNTTNYPQNGNWRYRGRYR